MTLAACSSSRGSPRVYRPMVTIATRTDPSLLPTSCMLVLVRAMAGIAGNLSSQLLAARRNDQNMWMGLGQVT